MYLFIVMLPSVGFYFAMYKTDQMDRVLPASQNLQLKTYCDFSSATFEFCRIKLIISILVEDVSWFYVVSGY